MQTKILSEEEKQIVLQAKVDALASQVKKGRLATLLSSSMLSVLFISTEGVGLSKTLVWIGFMVAAYIFRNYLVRLSFDREQDLEKTENIIALSSAALGLVIGSPAVFFMPAMEQLVAGLYVGLMVGWIAIAVVIIGIHFRSYVLFVVIGIVYLLIGIWISVPPALALATTLGGLGAAYMLISFSKQLSELFEESVLIRLERDKLVDRLTDSIAEAHQAQNERSRFLASTAHDLIQPVTSLLMLIDILRNSTSQKEMKQATAGIKSNAESIDSMFSGLLDLARLDQGAILPNLTEVKLGMLIRSIEAANRIRCEDKGIKLLVSCDDDVLVTADATLLDRILRNLVDNAIKYTNNGEINISVEESGEDVRIKVADSGVGIEEEHRGHIFDAFYRGASVGSPNVQGIGLGLSVAKQMAELMGGTMELWSEVGKGTVVSISLCSSGDVASSKNSATDNLYSLPEKVLVIEDSEAARNALQLWLKNNGVESVVADSLDCAEAEMEEKDFNPQHAIVDFHLGASSNGIDVIRKLRRSRPNLPATLITGTLLEIDMPEEDVVVLKKPLKPDKLREALSR